MLNDTSVASAGSHIRTCRRIRNSKKIATIRDFHQNICVDPTNMSSNLSFVHCIDYLMTRSESGCLGETKSGEVLIFTAVYDARTRKQAERIVFFFFFFFFTKQSMYARTLKRVSKTLKGEKKGGYVFHLLQLYRPTCLGFVCLFVCLFIYFFFILNTHSRQRSK